MRKLFFISFCIIFIIITSLILIDEYSKEVNTSLKDSQETSHSSNIEHNSSTKINQEDYVDYPNMVVTSISENSIGICFICNDPEAECACVDVFVDEDTIITGIINNFSELNEDDNVHVWIKDKEGDKKIAEKIEVLH